MVVTGLKELKTEKCLSLLKRKLEETKDKRREAVGYNAYEHFYLKEKILEELIKEVSSYEEPSLPSDLGL